MIVRRWLVEGRDLFGVFAPVKVARVNNKARNSRAMATNPLGARMGYYICAVLNRTYKISTATKCVVNLEFKTRESVSFIAPFAPPGIKSRTINGMSFSCAKFANALKSGTFARGLPILSIYKAFVLS